MNYLICDLSGKILCECNTLQGALLHVRDGRVLVVSERTIYDKRISVAEIYKTRLT